MEKTMKKDKPLKKPRGRQPIGAVLIDGKWQMTELAAQLAAERVLRLRERGRIWYRKTRELLRIARPELFVPRGMDPRQTTLEPRSTEREVVRAPCQKTNTSSTADTYDAFWRSAQRDDGAPNRPSGSASL